MCLSLHIPVTVRRELVVDYFQPQKCYPTEAWAKDSKQPRNIQIFSKELHFLLLR